MENTELLETTIESKTSNRSENKIDKKATKKIKEILKNHNIYFYNGDFEDSTILLLPYFLQKYKLKITFKISIDDVTQKYNMGFDCNLNKEKDSNEQLLNMNSELLDGVLSIAPNSDKVTYLINGVINDKFTYEEYEKILSLCIFVFVELYNQNIINRIEYEGEDDE